MTLPRRFTLVAVFALALAIVLGGAWLMVVLRTRPAPERVSSLVTQIGGPFTLIDTSGKTVTDQTYRGKWMLIFFGYTACPDACPTALNNMSVALAKLGPKAANLQPLFITVDPKRDTPRVLADYLRSFDPRITGLSGSPAQIDEVTKIYRVYAAPREGGGSKYYLVDHSAYLYVMDPRGKFVKVIGGGESGDRMADKLRLIMGGWHVTSTTLPA